MERLERKQGSFHVCSLKLRCGESIVHPNVRIHQVQSRLTNPKHWIGVELICTEIGRHQLIHDQAEVY